MLNSLIKSIKSVAESTTRLLSNAATKIGKLARPIIAPFYFLITPLLAVLIMGWIVFSTALYFALLGIGVLVIMPVQKAWNFIKNVFNGKKKLFQEVSV